jgi:hypothetical protein
MLHLVQTKSERETRLAGTLLCWASCGVTRTTTPWHAQIIYLKSLEKKLEESMANRDLEVGEIPALPFQSDGSFLERFTAAQQGHAPPPPPPPPDSSAEPAADRKLVLDLPHVARGSWWARWAMILRWSQ